MPIGKLSELASSFPAIEVEYVDMFGSQYRVDGRYGVGNTIDCIGVILEVYKRAGLLLPDPKIMAGQVAAFADLFDKVTEPDQLYDLINLRRDSNHLLVVVRQGVAVSATVGKNVYTSRVNILKRVPGAEFFRVRSSCLPV